MYASAVEKYVKKQDVLYRTELCKKAKDGLFIPILFYQVFFR